MWLEGDSKWIECDPEVLGKLRKRWTGKGPYTVGTRLRRFIHVPGYEIVPRKGGIVYGDEFIDAKIEMIYRAVEPDSI